LADIRAQLFRLAEGHPGRGAEAFSQGGSPEHQNVDAGVWQPVEAKRANDAPVSVLSAPRLEPGTDAALQMSDDLLGDPAVDVRAGRVRAVAVAAGFRLAILHLVSPFAMWFGGHCAKRRAGRRKPGGPGLYRRRGARRGP